MAGVGVVGVVPCVALGEAGGVVGAVTGVVFTGITGVEYPPPPPPLPQGMEKVRVLDVAALPTLSKAVTYQLWTLLSQARLGTPKEVLEVV